MLWSAVGFSGMLHLIAGPLNVSGTIGFVKGMKEVYDSYMSTSSVTEMDIELTKFLLYQK